MPSTYRGYRRKQPGGVRNACIDITGRYHDDLGRFTNKIGWFVDGVLNNNLKPLVNAIKVGEISENILTYLKAKGIELGTSNIDLTYGDLHHANRKNKNPLQKVTKDQSKRVIDIIKENNVYYDTNNNNIIYISSLPPEEIKGDRDWLKIPVYFDENKNTNRVITMSIIPSTSILKSPKEYEKID